MTEKATAKPATGKPVQALRVSTTRGTTRFCRAGINFSETPIELPLDNLKPEQIKAIKADPALKAEQVTITPTEGEG